MFLSGCGSCPESLGVANVFLKGLSHSKGAIRLGNEHSDRDWEIKTRPLRVLCFSLSIDGFAAGPEQNLVNPNGIGGLDLHEWFFPTATFERLLHHKEAGTTGIDDDFAARGVRDIGAWIPGRKMFGPVRGPWPDERWKGRWGENPPFHTPAFVLTHYERAPIEMAGGTIFHFITERIHAALDRAALPCWGS